MATQSTLSSFVFVVILFLFVSPTPTLSKKSTYIVHMSHSHKPAPFASTHDWYSSILHSLSPTTSGPNVLYTYSHSATGFAAHISESHAAKLNRLPSVLSVVPDQIVEPATTHTPSFLGLSDRSGLWPSTSYGSDTIIGVVDSGIWPESDSFNDQGLGDVPAHWKGICESGPNFPASACNKKIIGARLFYRGPADPTQPRAGPEKHSNYCSVLHAATRPRHQASSDKALHRDFPCLPATLDQPPRNTCTASSSEKRHKIRPKPPKFAQLFELISSHI